MRALQTTTAAAPDATLDGADALGHALLSLGLHWGQDPTRSRWHVELALRGFTDMPDELVAAWPESAWVLGSALLLLERHADSQGEFERSARLAAAAAEEQDHLGARLDALSTRLCAGRALAAAGRPVEASAELRTVADAAGRAQAWSLRYAASSALRGLGIRLAPLGPQASAVAAAAAPGALTRREFQVAELVAQGRTNKQVAATLFLSEKTIEHHLSRAYAKLGVRSRTELTATWYGGAGDPLTRPL